MLTRKMTRSLIVALTLTAVGVAARAQFSELYTFNSNYDGCCDYYAGYLAQGADGNMHGSMGSGSWSSFYGSWFDYTIGGGVTIHELTSTAAQQFPYAGLTMGIDGNLYGASTHGGLSTPSGSTYGALFRISNGQITTVYQFSGGANGSYPYSPPIQAPDGNLYGVTSDPANTGYVYQILMNNGVGSRGWVHPLPGASITALAMASDGNMYGTVPVGGFTINGVAPNNNNAGAIFQVTLGGVVTGIYNMSASSGNNNGAGDGTTPYGGVIQAADGYLYGANSQGGSYASGTLYRVALNGTNFSVIHNFQFDDGTVPTGTLMVGSDGYLYGATAKNGYMRNFILFGGGLAFTPEGSLFKTDTTGANFTRLFTLSKTNSTGQGTGNNPYATPTMHTSGVIYGVTLSGGTGPSGNSYGTYANGGELYSYNAAIAPFINVVVQRNAKVGDWISIIGQGFLNTTTVTFNGLAANKLGVQVLSDTFMRVQVPAGATTGRVVVQEFGGTNPSTPYNLTIACSGLLCLHR